MKRIRARALIGSGLALGSFLLVLALFTVVVPGRRPPPTLDVAKESVALPFVGNQGVHEGLLAQFLTAGESQTLRTHEQEELVRWARWRYSAAGLELPDVDLFFLENTMSCGGREGLYHSATSTLYICTARKQTLLHELAHAWTDARLTEELRTAFVRLRGIRSWNDRNDPWELRGTEHAAEIITWALMDRPIHVPTRPGGPDAEPIFRLLSIPNSDVDSLALGYQLLTGSFPAFRHASEWEQVIEVGNPELRYAR